MTFINVPPILLDLKINVNNVEPNQKPYIDPKTAIRFALKLGSTIKDLKSKAGGGEIIQRAG